MLLFCFSSTRFINVILCIGGSKICGEMGLTKLPLQCSNSGNAFEIITRNNFRIRTKELFSETALKKLIEVVEDL